MSTFRVINQNTAEINGKTYTLNQFKALLEGLGIQTKNFRKISDYIDEMRQIQQIVDREDVEFGRGPPAALKPSASWNGTFFGAQSQQGIKYF